MSKAQVKKTRSLFKNSHATKVVVWALVVIIIISSFATLTLFAAGNNEQKYNMNAISKAAATVWSHQGPASEDGGTEDTPTTPDTIVSDIRGTDNIYVAANFMGFNANNEIADSSSTNSMTVMYSALNDNDKYAGAYGYAVYGHMLYMMGYDTIVDNGMNSSDNSASAASRRLQGGLLLLTYLGHKSYTTIMTWSLELLQKLNVFYYLYDYAKNVTLVEDGMLVDGSYSYTYRDINGVEHTEYGNTTGTRGESYNTETGEVGYVYVDSPSEAYGTNPGMVDSANANLGAAPDSPGPFRKAMKYMARIYTLLFNMGWTIVLPFLFVILGFAFMLYTHRVNRARPANSLWPHMKKIIVYILWLALIVPSIATLYTAALDHMVSNAENGTNNKLADNIVQSTLVDFSGWANYNGLGLTFDDQAYVPKLATDANTLESYPAGQLTPDTYFVMRSDAYQLNQLIFGNGLAGNHSVFGQENLQSYINRASGTYGTSFDTNGDPVISSLLGVNSNVAYADGEDNSVLQNDTLELILRFMTNETVNASSIASSEQGIFLGVGNDEDRSSYWEAAVNPDTYTTLATEGYGLRVDSNKYCISDGSNSTYDFFTKYNNLLIDRNTFNQSWISALVSPITGEGKSFGKTTTGFSALGLYNYMSTDFSNSKYFTVYDNSEGRNITTNVNHYSVSAVGTGAIRWLYIGEACSFMLACAFIGLAYCFGMLFSVLKHSIQAMLALVKGVMSDMASMVKAIILAFWMCIEIIFTCAMYSFLTEFLVGVASLIERSFMKMAIEKMMDNGTNIQTATIGGNILMILMLIIRIIAFLSIMILAIKFRKSFIKSITELFEIITDRLVGARTSVSNQGTPYADAIKKGLSNFGTTMVVGATNMGHSIVTGDARGIIGGAIRGGGLALAGASAAQIAESAGWFDNAAQGVANAVTGGAGSSATEVMSNSYNNNTSPSDTTVNNSETGYSKSDNTSRSEGTGYQYNENDMQGFEQRVEESFDNGTINSSNSLDENAAIFEDLYNGGAEGNTSISNDNGYTDNSSDTPHKNADSPVKGASGAGGNATNVQRNYQNSTNVQNSNSENKSVQTRSADNRSSNTQHADSSNRSVNRMTSAESNILKQNAAVTHKNAANGRVATSGESEGRRGLGVSAGGDGRQAGNRNVATNGNRSVQTSVQVKNPNNGTGKASGGPATTNRQLSAGRSAQPNMQQPAGRSGRSGLTTNPTQKAQVVKANGGNPQSPAMPGATGNRQLAGNRQIATQNGTQKPAQAGRQNDVQRNTSIQSGSSRIDARQTQPNGNRPTATPNGRQSISGTARQNVQNNTVQTNVSRTLATPNGGQRSAEVGRPSGVQRSVQTGVQGNRPIQSGSNRAGTRQAQPNGNRPIATSNSRSTGNRPVNSQQRVNTPAVNRPVAVPTQKTRPVQTDVTRPTPAANQVPNKNRGLTEDQMRISRKPSAQPTTNVALNPKRDVRPDNSNRREN